MKGLDTALNEASENELCERAGKLGIVNDEVGCSTTSINESDIEYVDEEPRNIILALLSQLKKGMDLNKIAFPTFVLEPRSMLERVTDFVSHPHLIIK